MSFCNEHTVALHVFGWEDYYSGSVMPKRGQTSGKTVVEQVRAYEDTQHRRQLAAAIIRGSIHNMRTNVVYYNGRDHDPKLKSVIWKLQQGVSTRVSPIDELMGIEATARKAYYRSSMKSCRVSSSLPAENIIRRRTN